MSDEFMDDVVDKKPKDHVYLDSENKFYDYDAAAGLPLWLDEKTLRTVFSFRYDSPAFNDQYMQEDYRNDVHKEYSDLIKDLIRTRIELERAKATGMAPFSKCGKIYDDKIINKGNVIEIATGFGLEPKRIPVSTIKEEVVSSLEDMFSDLIRERPGMNTEDKETAVRFLDDQLWDEDAQCIWKCVHAEVLADLYSYDNLPDGIKIIRALTEYAIDDLKNGLHQNMDPTNVNMDEILNDDIVTYVQSAVDLNKTSSKPNSTDWIIQEALFDVENGDY